MNVITNQKKQNKINPYNIIIYSYINDLLKNLSSIFNSYSIGKYITGGTLPPLKNL